MKNFPGANRFQKRDREVNGRYSADEQDEQDELWDSWPEEKSKSNKGGNRVPSKRGEASKTSGAAKEVKTVSGQRKRGANKNHDDFDADADSFQSGTYRRADASKVNANSEGTRRAGTRLNRAQNPKSIYDENHLAVAADSDSYSGDQAAGRSSSTWWEAESVRDREELLKDEIQRVRNKLANSQRGSNSVEGGVGSNLNNSYAESNSPGRVENSNPRFREGNPNFRKRVGDSNFPNRVGNTNSAEFEGYPSTGQSELNANSEHRYANSGARKQAANRNVHELEEAANSGQMYANLGARMREANPYESERYVNRTAREGAGDANSREMHSNSSSRARTIAPNSRERAVNAIAGESMNRSSGVKRISNHYQKSDTEYLNESNFENVVELPVSSSGEQINRYEAGQTIPNFDFGALAPFVNDSKVEEIWINGPTQIFIAVAGNPHQLPLEIAENEIREMVERLLMWGGRRLDLSNPFVDARLPDGSRLHVAIPEITPKHWAVNIRKHTSRGRELAELANGGAMSSEVCDFLTLAVQSNLNIMVSGSTQAGKTTLLNALVGEVPAGTRVITIEEVFELNPDVNDWVALQTRSANLQGEGEIPLRRLIKESLRMRPDRIVVGEIREAESLDLLIALNSGLPGMGTIHANSGVDAIAKLQTLPLLAGENITHSFISPLIANCIDLVVHTTIEKSEVDGKRRTRRRIDQVLSVTGRLEGGRIETEPIFAFKQGKYERGLVEVEKLLGRRS